MTDSSEPISPRITALERELRSGNAAALESFWEQVKAEGTPLIEPIEGEDDHSIVTFLWRGGEETMHVVLGRELWTSGDVPDRQLRQLKATDLFCCTYRFRNDFRTVYRFAANAPLVSKWHSDEPSEQWYTFIAKPNATKPDPLNRHQWVIPSVLGDPDSGGITYSVLELPATPPQPWIARREGVARGDVQTYSFRSTILDNERQVWVYTPPGYVASGEPYGLLLAFDGWLYLNLCFADCTLDNLLAEGRIPPLVAVLIANPTPTSRNLELPCYEPFADFLATELVPWVRRSYHVTTEPTQTVATGVSYGGLAASFVAFRHPELFGNVLSQSGGYFWGPGYDDPAKDPRQYDVEWEWLTKQYAASPKLPLRFYLDAGLHEVQSWYPTGGILDASRRLRDVLMAKGYPFHYVEFNGGHEIIWDRGNFADGLMALIGTSEHPR